MSHSVDTADIARHVGRPGTTANLSDMDVVRTLAAEPRLLFGPSS
jgi:hypothetical protein